MPFDSPEARKLNLQIFETIYHAALEASSELAEKLGPYESYKGSPAEQGQLQYDLWGVTPTDLWDWTELKAKIAHHGLRNSLLVAPMPTASTSQILGNNECFEPYTSNIYTRRVLAGEFQVVCPWLLRDLVERDMWNDDMKNMIIAHNGSVANIPTIPDDIKQIYKTVWEISQKVVIDLAADRGAFICQSQSLNIHLQAPTLRQLTSMHFYGWKKGLKTGMYYLRTRPAAQAIQFTIDQSVIKNAKTQGTTAKVPGLPTPTASPSPVRPAARPTQTAEVEMTEAMSSVSIAGSSTSTTTVTDAPVASTSVATSGSGTPGLTEAQEKAAAEDPEFAAALQRQRERQEAILQCSIENKDACLMCSG